jgi:hypothetical protein
VLSFLKNKLPLSLFNLNSFFSSYYNLLAEKPGWMSMFSEKKESLDQIEFNTKLEPRAATFLVTLPSTPACKLTQISRGSLRN